ncbi:MAG: enoyl-CoA hydratase/isomerase family protein [Fidelibacterota bacterium]|nr:MAG: enoyl-CoA hydratase/isomerase family protein [Candidatus Neomarinimicrobiota bacterium]
MDIRLSFEGDSTINLIPSTRQFVQLDKVGWIATLTLSRPPVNALSQEMIGELNQAVEALAVDETVSVVVVRSDQPHFCVGADLKERQAVAPNQVASVVSAIRDCFQNLAELPQPTIAAVNGSALGGGAELALACDLRVMDDDVRFGLSETSLGIIPGAGGSQRLPRLIGLSQAKELIFSARTIEAEECLKLGLADRIVPAARLHDAADSFARELARNAPLALRAAKEAIRKGMDLPLAEALDVEARAYAKTIPTRDRVEGIKAFLEKRIPDWEGK